jgi:hypothetical protein
MTSRKVLLLGLSAIALAGAVAGSAASRSPAFTAAKQAKAPSHYAPSLGVVRSPRRWSHDDSRVGTIGIPGVTLFILGEPNAKEKWRHWYQQSIANTRKLHIAGVKLVFGTDVPFTMGNFFHSAGNEIEALRLAGVPDSAILEMATSRAAEAASVVPSGRSEGSAR